MNGLRTILCNAILPALVLASPAQALSPPPSAIITGVSPSQGRPMGGEIVTITGGNFQSPNRAIFDLGGGNVLEAFIVSATSGEIRIITPNVKLTAPAQSAHADLYVITAIGTYMEQRLKTDFLFINAELTPRIVTASPQTGTFTGGTRVTIFGDAFQAPIQVFFGNQEAQVLSVSLKQVTVLTPPGQPGPVSLRVVNVNSRTEATLPDAYRYKANMVLSRISPDRGPASGGTVVTIDGSAFGDPVSVSFAGVATTVLSMSDSQIVAVTHAQPQTCADRSGDVDVVSLDDGSEVRGLKYTYLGERPLIADLQPAVVAPGDHFRVRVTGAAGKLRFQLGSLALEVLSENALPAATEYELIVPADFVPPSAACSTQPDGTGLRSVTAALTVTSSATGCLSTEKTLTIRSRTGCNPLRRRPY
jgi:hypothetical protein